MDESLIGNAVLVQKLDTSKNWSETEVAEAFTAPLQGLVVTISTPHVLHNHYEHLQKLYAQPLVDQWRHQFWVRYDATAASGATDGKQQG